MNNIYLGNLTRLRVLNDLLFGKSVKSYNHEEWLILIFIFIFLGGGDKISNGPFNQKHTSILV